MRGGGWGYWGWGWWFWIFWGAIVLIFWLIISFGRDRNEISEEERDLRERYARGEMTTEDFRRRLDELHRAA